MKKFKKAIAVVMALALVITSISGIGVTSNVSADETIDLGYWTFIHQGTNTWGEAGNTGIISKVTMNDTGEVLDGWLSDDSGTGSETDPAYMQEQTATQISSGFALEIANTGWDADWANDTINPWSVEAVMRNIDLAKKDSYDIGVYSVSFTAYATKNKYGYVTFGSDYEGIAPYGNYGLEEGSNDRFIEIYTYPVTYTYNFVNWVGSDHMDFVLMLGAFDSQYGFDGEDLSDVEDHGVENTWSGTVYVSDFTVTRIGSDVGLAEPTIQMNYYFNYNEIPQNARSVCFLRDDSWYPFCGYEISMLPMYYLQNVNDDSVNRAIGGASLAIEGHIKLVQTHLGREVTPSAMRVKKEFSDLEKNSTYDIEWQMIADSDDGSYVVSNDDTEYPLVAGEQVVTGTFTTDENGEGEFIINLGLVGVDNTLEFLDPVATFSSFNTEDGNVTGGEDTTTKEENTSAKAEESTTQEEVTGTNPEETTAQGETTSAKTEESTTQEETTDAKIEESTTQEGTTGAEIGEGTSNEEGNSTSIVSEETSGIDDDTSKEEINSEQVKSEENSNLGENNLYETDIYVNEISSDSATKESASVKLSKTVIKSAKRSAKKLTVKVKKVSGAKGYEVSAYGTKKNAKKNKKAIATVTSTKKKIVVSSKKIKKAKKVYVKVRAYTADTAGIKSYGAWSKTKKIK